MTKISSRTLNNGIPFVNGLLTRVPRVRSRSLSRHQRSNKRLLSGIFRRSRRSVKDALCFLASWAHLKSFCFIQHIHLIQTSLEQINANSSFFPISEPWSTLAFWSHFVSFFLESNIPKLGPKAFQNSDLPFSARWNFVPLSLSRYWKFNFALFIFLQLLSTRSNASLMRIR